MPLPLIKLGSLFVKTLSKPLANAIKRNVKTHPRLSDGIAIPAQGVFNFYLLLLFCGVNIFTVTLNIGPASRSVYVSTKPCFDAFSKSK